MCVSLCTTVVHNTAKNSSDNFPSYPPDNHHSLDHVYRSGGGWKAERDDVDLTLAQKMLATGSLMGVTEAASDSEALSRPARSTSRDLWYSSDAGLSSSGWEKMDFTAESGSWQSPTSSWEADVSPTRQKHGCYKHSCHTVITIIIVIVSGSIPLQSTALSYTTLPIGLSSSIFYRLARH